ncbi:hypothetical protein L3Q67_02370 [Saccharothrix sp. AJ9571]|nr:hypothetical protein L3Q67_02370 [Saccharothrix sp. AJ9571]
MAGPRSEDLLDHFFGDLNVGGLLGHCVLVDMTGDRCDPRRGPRPFEGQQTGR